MTLAFAQGSRIRKDTDLMKDKNSIKDMFHDNGESVILLAGEFLMEVQAKWKPVPRRMHSKSQSQQSQGLFNVDDA